MQRDQSLYLYKVRLCGPATSKSWGWNFLEGPAPNFFYWTARVSLIILRILQFTIGLQQQQKQSWSFVGGQQTEFKTRKLLMWTKALQVLPILNWTLWLIFWWCVEHSLVPPNCSIKWRLVACQFFCCCCCSRSREKPRDLIIFN